MFRTAIVIVAASAGLAAGFLAWLASGGPTSAQARLAPLEAQAAGLRAPQAFVAQPQAIETAELASEPIFQMTTGPGAVPPPVLRLDGLVRARGRIAGLISVNDKPAEWISQGETRDGVTLVSVAPNKVVLDTVYGPVELGLGQRQPSEAPSGALAPQPSAPTSAVNAAVTPPRYDNAPPGLRAPPPASAPRRP